MKLKIIFFFIIQSVSVNYASAENDNAYTAQSNIQGLSNIIAWGDSLTRGAGASNQEKSYPSLASKALGKKVENEGIGGQSSTQISVRHGSTPFFVAALDGIIRESGSTPISKYSLNVLMNSGQARGFLDGYIDGQIEGRIVTDPDGNYTFERSYDGDQYQCDELCTFSPKNDKSATNWIWVGRNNLHNPDKVISDIAAMISWIAHDRYLVGGVIYGVKDKMSTIIAAKYVNAHLKETYKHRYVDIPQILIEKAVNSDDDNFAIELGATPPSLQSDAVHLNDEGYKIVADAFVSSHKLMGW